MGFANLPNQVFRKSVKRGFQFSLMVVGKWMGGVNEMVVQVWGHRWGPKECNRCKVVRSLV